MSGGNGLSENDPLLPEDPEDPLVMAPEEEDAALDELPVEAPEEEVPVVGAPDDDVAVVSTPEDELAVAAPEDEEPFGDPEELAPVEAVPFELDEGEPEELAAVASPEELWPVLAAPLEELWVEPDEVEEAEEALLTVALDEPVEAAAGPVVAPCEPLEEVAGLELPHAASTSVATATARRDRSTVLNTRTSL